MALVRLRFSGLRHRVHLDSSQVVRAELEQGGVAIDLEARFHRGGVGGLALALEFLDGKHVEGDGVAAEAKLVQGGGVVEQPALAAFVLA